MAMGKLSYDAVIKAIEEYDALGRAGFLATYGYQEARHYLLMYNGREYDAKAIAGVAHKFEDGRALTSQEFSGGKEHAAAWLEKAGFQVKVLRNPDWAWDELVLACDLVARHGWKGLDANNPEVVELSELLQMAPIHPPESRNGTFRNQNGVARKSFDIATHRPGYAGRKTKGGALDLQVIDAFRASPNRMAESAERIRQGLRSGDLTGLPQLDESEPDDIAAPEGRLLLRRHLARERSRPLRKRKIDSVLRAGRKLACEVCDFDFEQQYGERGAGYIECHHVVPLHEAGEGTTKLADLALICANCHRMIHRKAPWPTPRKLRALIGKLH